MIVTTHARMEGMMTVLTINLPDHIYEQLRATAHHQHTTIEAVAEEWLVEKSATSELSGRTQLQAVLRAAGKLVAPSPQMQRLAAESTLTLDEARAILDRAGGKPLSEVILEMRGPKE
jgi:plasmid stability protein